jgi:hypothetical protein
LVLSLGFTAQSQMALSQTSKGEAITCYKDVIKEPFTFYGNPGDVFTLYDNSTWKVASGGQYEYVPVRYKDVLICPAAGKLVIGNKALSISKN